MVLLGQTLLGADCMPPLLISDLRPLHILLQLCILLAVCNFSSTPAGYSSKVRPGMDERTQLEMCERMWIEEPVFFISTCTRDRRAILNSEQAVGLLVEEWGLARKRHGWSVGRYLVMPDRVHFFCAADISARPLSQWLQIWKEWTNKRLARRLGLESPLWESSFSKDLLHSYESYCRQWEQVREHPVGAQLVQSSDRWPWQGEIEYLH